MATILNLKLAKDALNAEVNIQDGNFKDLDRHHVTDFGDHYVNGNLNYVLTSRCKDEKEG